MNKQHQTQPPDFLSPQGQQRYRSLAEELANELTTIRQSQRNRKRTLTVAACTLLLAISGTWVWSAFIFSNSSASFQKQATTNPPEITNQNNSIKNTTPDQTHSYYTKISKTKSTLVKTYTTAAVNENPAIKIKPITDEDLIELFRQSGKQIGLIETQGKTTLTGDVQITRLQTNHPDEKTPSSNASPLQQNTRQTTAS